MASLDILSDFPAPLESSIPLFNAEGCLPPGDFFPAQIEFERRFVSTRDQVQRAVIYRGWNLHRRELMDAGVPDTARQLLNGSYTTAKESHGDIDIALRYLYPTPANWQTSRLTIPLRNSSLGP